MTATSPAASPTTSLTARPVVPAAAALEAAPYWDAFAALDAAALDERVVTGDYGLDHYL